MVRRREGPEDAAALRHSPVLAVMRDGRVVQVGTPEEILTDPANDYIEQFVHDVDRARVLTAASVMEPAKAVIGPASGPRAALRMMRDQQTSAAFMTARDRTLIGSVRDWDALTLARRGGTDLASIVDRDVTPVRADAALADLFVPAVESALPLPVVDDRDRLVGVIPRVTLLAALGNISPTEEIAVVEQPPSVVVDAITDFLDETASGSEEVTA